MFHAFAPPVVLQSLQQQSLMEVLANLQGLQAIVKCSFDADLLLLLGEARRRLYFVDEVGHVGVELSGEVVEHGGSMQLCLAEVQFVERVDVVERLPAVDVCAKAPKIFVNS